MAGYRPRTRSMLAPAVLACLLLWSIAPVALADDVTPPETVIYAQPGAVTGAYVGIIFRGAPEGDVALIECRLDGGSWISPCPDPWVMTLSGGPHEAEGRAIDAVGNVDPTPAQVLFVVDDVGPIGQIELNRGATTTGRFLVRFDLANSDHNSSHGLRISSSPAVDDQGQLRDAWMGYEWQVAPGGVGSWDLTRAEFGGSSDTGSRAVYVQWTDQFGNVGPILSDSIVVEPGITDVSLRLGVTENPAPAGGLVALRATATAADGAALRDTVLRLTCPDGAHAAHGTAHLVLEVECSSRTWAPGTHHVVARFEGSGELRSGETSLDLEIALPFEPIVLTASLFALTALDPDTQMAQLEPGARSGLATAFECRIDGGAWSPCGPVWSVPNPGPGLHWLESRARNAQGNWSDPSEPIQWRVAPPSVGWFALDDARLNGGFATPDPIVGLTLHPGSATAVRISSSPVVDLNGLLISALETSSPTDGLTSEWDVERSDLGGSAGDGWKWIAVQYRNPDGSWEVPRAAVFLLDRVPPPLALVVNAGYPFVDADDVMVLPKTTADTGVMFSEDRAVLDGEHPSVVPTFGYTVWHLQPAAPGMVAQRTIYARAKDGAGNLGSIMSASITIDRAAPISSLGAPGFVVGSTVSWTAVRIALAASSSDAGSGVSSTAIQEAIGTGSFSTVASSPSATLQISRTLNPATARTYRSRGTDRLAHVGAWALGVGLRPYVRDDRSTAVTYGSGWRRVLATGALGSRVMRTSTRGAKLTIRFTGRAIALVAPKRPFRGRAGVYVDGRYIQTIDLRSATIRRRLVVFSYKWATSGRHIVTLKALGTAGRRTVEFDGFAVIP